MSPNAHRHGIGTVYDGEFRRAIRLLSPFGTGSRTDFCDVLAVTVANVNRFFRHLAGVFQDVTFTGQAPGPGDRIPRRTHTRNPLHFGTGPLRIMKLQVNGNVKPGLDVIPKIGKLIMSAVQAKSTGWAKRRLLQRSQELRDDIRRELVKYDSERYSDLADQVADSGDKSVADLVVDVDLAEIDRDVQEFREVDAALLRIAHGTFGQCIDCGGEIEPDRLEALPSASRCHRCQRNADNPGREELHRTL